MHVQTKNIPKTLKTFPNWVLWKMEKQQGKDKATKVPYQCNGQHARSNNSRTWKTFSAAALALKKERGKYDGIGFVLSEGTPMGIDLDHCRCPAFSDIEIIAPWAMDIIKKVDSYTEASPSGRGIRIFAYSEKLPASGRNKKLPQYGGDNCRKDAIPAFEIYESGRYLTFTGKHIVGTPKDIMSREKEIESVYKQIFSNKNEEIFKQEKQPSQSLDIDKRLDKALMSKSGAAIRMLLNGDLSNYPSPSEADLALCSHLAFWFKGDKKIIDEIFRKSKRFREKWDKKHFDNDETYGQHTIEEAVKGCQNFYSEQSHRGNVNVYGIDDIIISSKDFIKIKMPERQSYLYPIIGEGQIILLSGQRGVGKTFFALSIADAVTAGKNFGPWKSRENVPTLYLDGEMAVPDIRERLRLINPSDDRKSPLYLYSDAYANLHSVPKASLLNEAWRYKIKQILSNRHIKFFIIDNISSLAAGIDENKKSDGDVVNQWLIELRFVGVTTLLLHHTGKDGKDQRGTSAREDNVDLSILLKRPHDYSTENGADFIVSFSKIRVPFEALKMMKDFRFTLTRDDSGNTLWNWGAVNATKKQEVTKMLADGCSYDEIIETTGVTKGYISQIKKKLDKERGL